MFKFLKKLLGIVLIIIAAGIVIALVFGGSDKPGKVGEVGQNTTQNSSAEGQNSDAQNETEQPIEVKTEYHVGDILKDGKMEIVYIASGEYKEANEFLQPADGNKYIFIRLAFENKGSSDSNVSTLDFAAYADGYDADMHYSDEDDISATLSPGRTTVGDIVFEIPKDAAEVEIEYETDFFTDEKIKFIYDGEKDSGYTVESNTTPSEGAFATGDVIAADDLQITYISCAKDPGNVLFKPAAGHHFVTLTLEFENKGSTDEIISALSFDCYADGISCKQEYFRDDSLSATISAGHKTKGTITFEVPDGATTVEAEYLSNIWTSERIVFTVNE